MRKPTKTNGQPKLQGRRFTDDDRERAFKLIDGRVKRTEVARVIGTTTTSLGRWEKAAGRTPASPDEEAHEAAALPDGGPSARAKNGEATAPGAMPASPSSNPSRPSASARDAARSPYAPRDPGQGLGDHEVAAILELKKKHPSMGPAQLRAQLKRFQGWRLSLKAIARVLKGHGYELVHRGSRPKGPEPIRFEAPRRNAIWQADYAEVRVNDERLYVLIVLDDFSRFVVGHALVPSPTSDAATATLKAAIARHGKPEAVRTDRGGAFIAYARETDFGRYLEAELIDHIVGRSYNPKGGGKVEAAVGTLRRELWDLEHFADRCEAEKRLRAFFEDYNEHRAHMGIDGLAPADRFFGRADRVLAAVDAVSRKRQGVAAAFAPLGAPTEEAGFGSGAPLEVLRLVLLPSGEMELRFCGTRVRLGRAET